MGGMAKFRSGIALILMIPAVMQIPNAFGDRSGGTPPASVQGRGVLRARAVTLAKGIFDGKKRPPMRVHMNFFPDVRIDVEWTKVEKTQNPAGFVWSGKVIGSSTGSPTLMISGKTVTANIPGSDGMIYQIRSTPEGDLWVAEVDQKALPRESEPRKPVNQ
jgi:hypothetical protein